MSIFGTPVFDGVGGFNGGSYESDPLDVPAGALIVCCAMYSSASGPLVSIASSDAGDTVVVENAQTDGTELYSWAYILSAAANPAKTLTATFTGSGSFGGLATWVVPISGSTALFDVLAALVALSGTGPQNAAYTTTGADEIGFAVVFDRNGIAGSSPWTAVSPAVLDNGNFGSTRCAADHQTYAAAGSKTIGLANTGSGLGGITAIAFKSAAPPTFDISGNAGVKAASIALTGDATASTTADSSGNFEFTGLSDGDYTITPTLKGYKFTPKSRSETVSGGDITGVNFTAKKNVFSRSK